MSGQLDTDLSAIKFQPPNLVFFKHLFKRNEREGKRGTWAQLEEAGYRHSRHSQRHLAELLQKPANWKNRADKAIELK